MHYIPLLWSGFRTVFRPQWKSCSCHMPFYGFSLSYLWCVFIKVRNLQHKAEYCWSLWFNDPYSNSHKRIQSNSIQNFIREYERVGNLVLCSRKVGSRNLISTLYPTVFNYRKILLSEQWTSMQCNICDSKSHSSFNY